MNQSVRVAITGAAGQIGYALLFRLASGQMFGQNVSIELHLLELESSLSALEGVAMELEDCAFPLLKKVFYTSDVKKAMDGVNWVICVGSMPRKPGMERADLLGNNGKIFIEQGKAINDYAASDVKIFVVGNPCNTNCLIAKHNAPDIPADRFYAMTTLDELRARMQLAKKAGVPINAVTQMTIWGNHSATQFPDFYHANISGVPAVAVIDDETWLKETFVTTVQQRGAAVLKARGSSSAASAANAIIKGVNNIITPTPTDETYSMCISSDGQYDIPKGLIFSFPCKTLANGSVQVFEGLTFNAYSQAKINDTLHELCSERDMLKTLGIL